MKKPENMEKHEKWQTMQNDGLCFCLREFDVLEPVKMVPRQGPKTHKNTRKQGRGREVENEAEMAKQKKREMKNTSKCFFGESKISLCQFPFHPEDDKQHPQRRGRKQHHPKEEVGKQHHARGGREGVGSSTTQNEEEQHTNTQK